VSGLDGVAVVFVNHHSEALVAPKLGPLLAAGARVVVVDNSGTHGDAAGVAVARPGCNLGFAAACNLALDQVGPDARAVCFHNPDLQAPPAAIARLASRLAGQPRPGLVAPAIRVGAVVRRHGYRYPSPAREAAVALRALARRGRPERDSGPSGRCRRAAGRGRRFGSGGLLLASPAALAAAGGFDRDYFLYGEDLDLWHRVGQLGFSTDLEPAVVVDHREATGGRMAPEARELLRWLGVELFAERTGTGWPRYRRVHRPLLAQLGDGAGPLGPLVAAAWSAGATPLEVQRAAAALLGPR